MNALPLAPRALYEQVVRLFDCQTPVVAAVQGAAIGAGLGLAVFADFRVASPEARFAANFTKLGYHPGFGLTHTLPRLIGQQRLFGQNGRLQIASQSAGILHYNAPRRKNSPAR